MTKTGRIAGAFIIALFALGACFSIYYLKLLGVESLKILLFSFGITALAFIGFFGVFMNSEIAFKGGFIGYIIALILLVFYVFAVKFGWLTMFSSRIETQRFISRYDGYAIAVFIAIQFLQVTVLPLPSTITTIAGIALFGVWKAVLYSTIGIIAGSIFAFYLGRIFGVKLVVWICGAKMYSKYRELTQGKDVLLLYAMFLLPFFPDDLLCLIAGLGTMSLRSFTVMMLITRPLGALWVAGVFKGAVSIPFNGWGIAVWAVIFIATLTIFIVLYKYGDEITKRLSAFTGKISVRFFSKKQIDVKSRSSAVCRKKSLSAISKENTSYNDVEKKAAKNKNIADYKN